MVSNTLAVLPIDMFVNIKKIDKVSSPVLIIHGTLDGVVPYVHGKELYDKVVNPYKFVSLEGAGHNDIECDFKDELFDVFAGFFEHLEGLEKKEQDKTKEKAEGREKEYDDSRDGSND